MTDSHHRSITLENSSSPTQNEAKKNKVSDKPEIGGVTQLFFNGFFFLFSIGYLPFFIKRLRQAESASQLLRERRGFFSRDFIEKTSIKKPIWIHAVSVGEVMAAKKFVELIRAKFPEEQVVFSTVTPTGQSIAREMESERVNVCYFPFDFSWIVKRFLKSVNPKVILLLETEIWPNLLIEASRNEIPVGIINGRLSEKSAKGYARLSFLFKKVFGCLEFVCSQTEEDAERYESVGVLKSRIQVLGSTKFDNANIEGLKEEVATCLKEKIRLEESLKIIVAGSTHPGEEEILLRSYQALLKENPFLRLLIAPRHVDRSDQVVKIATDYGLDVSLYSSVDLEKEYQVLVIDQMGVLKNLYALADVVFVGGSLVRHGGQNPIEPAGFKKAVLHGPHVFNFKQVYQMLDERKGACLVRSGEELAVELKSLLEDQERNKSLGETAYNLVCSMQGSSERHVNRISSYI